MYSIGITTTIMYVAALASILLALQYAEFFVFGLILGALLFAAATIILLTMAKKRADKKDS